jgi:DNA-binding winged helix-turn-helix (wHTH) protein
MPDGELSTGMVRFGVFDLDLRTGELRKKGTRVALQEQPFRMLAILVAHAGDLVTREELRARLWPGTTFMDFDHGLNKAVLKIRRALGDLAESPRFVETLERRGYRFIAPVERLPGRVVEDDGSHVPWRGFRLLWAGRAIPLDHGPNLIGRDPEARVWIDSPDVSRRHAQVLVAEATALLEDLGSKNGTHLNDRRISAPAQLADGDVIRIGPALAVFRSVPLSTPTKTADG